MWCVAAWMPLAKGVHLVRVWKRVLDDPRAPLQHGRSVLAPPYAALPSAVSANRQQTVPPRSDVASVGPSTAGKSHDSSCSMRPARTQRATGTLPCHQAIGRSLCGHQPQLFHPGVWFKNFLMDRLAQQVHGLAIHVIIDNDCAAPQPDKPPPAATRGTDHPRAARHRCARHSFEERNLLDTNCFLSVPDQVETGYGRYSRSNPS